MTLHCAATLLLVSPDTAAEVDELGLAASFGPWVEGIDVIAELQHVADQYRGERVLVTLSPEHLARVASHLQGRFGSRSGTTAGSSCPGMPVSDHRAPQNSRCSLLSTPLSSS
jgi:hypothetical protein